MFMQEHLVKEWESYIQFLLCHRDQNLYPLCLNFHCQASDVLQEGAFCQNVQVLLLQKEK